MNQLILGDCLEVLKELPDESVDLCYLDPPFFSHRHYEVIWGDKGEIRSFEDRWSGGIDHYIAWLKERVEQIYRVLKLTGSIFLHCDDHANAYIRVFILDKFFGSKNFRSELIWKRTSSHNSAKRFPQIHDTIYFYSKSEKYYFNPIKVKYSEEYAEIFKFKDNFGQYKRADLTGSGIRNGASGSIWHEYNPTEKGRHWAIPNNLKKRFNISDELDLLETLNYLDEQGVIIHAKNKGSLPSYKNYSSLSEGKIQQSIVDDIPPTKGKESIGYPTQKPEALLERIIQCASNENDIILDPFNGGGTTIAVADKLNRQWIGIDSSVAAIKVTEMRLDAQHGNISKNNDLKGQGDIHVLSDSFKPFTVRLYKYDYDVLRYQDAFEFEKLMIQQIGGIANNKQRGDLGLDGKLHDNTPIQVKRSDNIGRNVVDNFKSACERFNKTLFDKNKAELKPVGIIIAFSFGKGAVQEVARLKNEDGIVIQLRLVEEIIPISKKPRLYIHFHDLGLDAKNLREIEFIATAESNSGIEFFAWDWHYENNVFKFDVINDKLGKQKQKFKTGTHCIAVKVIDNDGLENMEVITLKINGEVQSFK